MNLLSKIGLVFTLVFGSALGINMTNQEVNAKEVTSTNEPEVVTIKSENEKDTKNFYYMKGLETTIKAEGDKTIIVNAKNEIVFELNNNEKNYIIGGGNNDGKDYKSTNIIMESGKINAIIAGSNGKGSVGTTNVVMNGGTVGTVSGGGATHLTNELTEKSLVNNANVVLNNGKANYVFGATGSGADSITENVNLSITGGIWGCITTSGSNGQTTKANATINGGVIKVLQNINRGTLKDANITIANQADIINAYLAGQPHKDNAKLHGTLEGNVSLNIKGNTVRKLEAGSNKEGLTDYVIDKNKVNITLDEQALKSVDSNVVNSATVSMNNKENFNPIYVEQLNAIFAYGNKVVIDKKEANTVATINNKEYILNETTKVFGGGYNTDQIIPESNIIMENGNVTGIWGGSNGKGYVKETNVTINGGVIESVFGGGTTTTTTSKVGNTHVTLNGGEIPTKPIHFNQVAGAGSSINTSAVSTNVTINGGKWNLVTAGGVNGEINKANVIVNNGHMNILQGVNRGVVKDLNVTVNNGTIKSMVISAFMNRYIDQKDASEYGTVDNAKVIIDEACINTLYPGAHLQAFNLEKLVIDRSCIENIYKDKLIDLNTLANEYVDVTIKNDSVVKSFDISELDQVSTLKDNQEFKDIITKDGYKFEHFKVEIQPTATVSKSEALADGIVTLDEKLSRDATLVPVFTKSATNTNPENNNSDNKDNSKEQDKGVTHVTSLPKTGNENVAIAGVLAIVAISLGYINRRYFN